MPAPRLDLRLLVRRGSPRHDRALRLACTEPSTCSAPRPWPDWRWATGRDGSASSTRCRSPARDWSGRRQPSRCSSSWTGSRPGSVERPPAGGPAATPREGAQIESDRFRVQAAGDGTLTIDDLPSGRRFEGLHAVEDEVDMGDLYNFCPVDGAGVWRGAAASTRILSDGPQCWELEVSYRGERPARPRRRATAAVRRRAAGAHHGRAAGAGQRPDRVHDHGRQCRRGPPAARRVPGRRGGRPGPRRGPVRGRCERPLVPPAPRAPWCEPPDPTQHTVGAVALGPLALFTRGLPEYEARPGPPAPSCA